MANMPRWGSPFQLWARQNNLAVKGARYNFLSLSGGTYYFPYERRLDLYQRLKEGLEAKVPSFLVECRPEDKTQAYRLIVDFDADAESLDEVEDAEWGPLLHCFFSTVAEVFDSSVKAVLCKADSKLRSKDGVKVRKSGLHIIFPELYVTDAEALGLRDLCIRRVREQRVLENCPILRRQRLEELFDDSIYEANGFRMIENHKASCCADCARRRRGKNHEAQRVARSRGESAPKDVYWRFEDCEHCRGAGYIYEGRPYRPARCVSWNAVLREIEVDADEILRLQSDAIYMFQRLSVCVEPGTPRTPLRHGVELPVVETAASKKRGGGGGAASAVAPRKGIVGGQTASGWTYLPASSDGYAELDNVIFEFYRHPSFDPDPKRSEPQLVLPHGIADMKRSPDSLCIIVNSISSDCMNKRRVATSPEHSQHSRSRVYFVITRSREVDESTGIPDAYISQRCHCQKSYGGVSCKTYKSLRRQLPAEVTALLWPPKKQHVFALLHKDHEEEVDAAIVAACEEAEKAWSSQQRRRCRDKPITDTLVLKHIPELRDISLFHLLVQGRGDYRRDFDLVLRAGGAGVEAVEGNGLLEDLEHREAEEAEAAAALG